MIIYFNDDKTLCVSYAKVGTSFLGGQQGFKKRGSGKHRFTKNEFSNYKNLIILYKEPYERFYSGVIQAMITSGYFNPQDIIEYTGIKDIDFSKIFTNRIFWEHKFTLLKQRIDSAPHNGSLESFFNSMYEWHRHCNQRLVVYKHKGYLDYIDHFVNLKNLSSTWEELGYEINQVRPEVTNSTNNNLYVDNKEEVLNIFKTEWNNIGLKESTDIFLKEEVELFNMIEDYVSHKSK